MSVTSCTLVKLLGRITRTAEMRPIATDVARKVVCLCDRHTDVPCKNG